MAHRTDLDMTQYGVIAPVLSNLHLHETKTVFFHNELGYRG